MGYWQIPVSGDDVRKTSFFCHSEPMLRVVKNAVWDEEFRRNAGSRNETLLFDMDYGDNYIDDLIVYTKDWESHLGTLKE